jgi:hypothetical protein
MSDRITIRQAGGAPQPRQWDDTVALPSVSPPKPTTLDESDLRRQRELANEEVRWNHAIGYGINERDRFVQKWIAKHTDE